jgi:hypothetical protein
VSVFTPTRGPRSTSSAPPRLRQAVDFSVTTIAVALVGGAVGALGSTYLSGLQVRGERFRERRIEAADDYLRAIARTRVALRALESPRPARSAMPPPSPP